MSILEARIPVLHHVWVDTDERNSHGNKVGGFASDPVPRKVIQVYPASGTINRSDVVNPNVVVRTQTDLMLDVDDPSVYGPRDEVTILGVRFKVQGTPGLTSYDMLPIEGYADIVPAQVHIKRVT